MQMADTNAFNSDSIYPEETKEKNVIKILETKRNDKNVDQIYEQREFFLD